jgi:hypothetical protein
MAELNSDSLGAGTWEDEIGGVIPRGTSTTPPAALSAAIALTEMSLAVFGDPDKDTPAWYGARDMARRVIAVCDLGGVMTRQGAAELLERVAIGHDGAVVSLTVTRILTDPAYAREVWTEAREFLDEYHPGQTDLRERVEIAAQVLGLVAV